MLRSLCTAAGVHRPITAIVCVSAIASIVRCSEAAQADKREPTQSLDRAALVVPDAVWQMVDDELGLGGGNIGFDPFDVQRFGRDDYLLRPVLQRFVGVRDTLRFSGHTTDLLLNNAAYPDELIRHAFALCLDEHVGRRVRIGGMDSRGISGELPDTFDPEQEDGSWGVDWLLDNEGQDMPADRAFANALARAGISATGVHWIDDGMGLSLSQEQSDQFLQLPEQAKRLAVRLLVASAEAHLPMQRATGIPVRFGAIGDAGEDRDAGPAAIGIRVWDQDRYVPKSLYDVTGETDLGALGTAGVVLAKRIRLAVEEFRRAGGPQITRVSDLDEFRLTVATYAGPVIISGTGDDRHTRGVRVPPLLVIELGGDDEYVGTYAVANGGTPCLVATVVDLGGDDSYRPRDRGDAGEDAAWPLQGGFSLASGVFGIGMLFDLGGGDDTYVANAASLGAGFHGVGLLYDDGGNDTYDTTGSYGQGVGHVGLGALIDRAGNDTYVSGTRSQAHGSTRGAGLLVDVSGDDTYTIRDEADPSALYLGRTVAMSQGCGYGRRADLGDGESMAGGFGVLVDGAGNDTYSAMAWSQGCAYWWGVGIFEDRGGDDIYRQGKYSQGAAAHFGVGVFVDLYGDDRYNAAPERMTNVFTGEEQWIVENQYAGHARDGSMGIMVDGGGDDVYVLRANSAGNADLNSAAFFWDRAGNDRYVGLDIAAEPANPNWQRPPLGTVTRYPDLFRTFRDDLPSLAVFLDTGGHDVYEGLRSPAANGSTWRDNAGKSGRAVGIDTDR